MLNHFWTALCTNCELKSTFGVHPVTALVFAKAKIVDRQYWYIFQQIILKMSHLYCFAVAPQTLREVRIRLLSDSIGETVTSVLRTCDIPLDYINSVRRTNKVASNAQPDRPIRWDKSFYDFYGIPNPFSEKHKRAPDETLRSVIFASINILIINRVALA